MTTSEAPKYKLILANLGLFYAAAIWGSTFIVVKDALNEVDPLAIVAYRFTISGLLMIPWLLIVKRPILKDWRQGLVLGVILWLLYVPQTIGLGITSASNSGFITGLFVAFVPVFLRLIFKRKPTYLEVGASGLSLIGLWILTGGMKSVNNGDLLTLITAMAYALHLLYSDVYMKRGCDPLAISCQQFLVVGLLSLVASGVTGGSLALPSSKSVGIILFLALFPGLFAFVIQMWAQKIVAPLTVALVFALEPVFAAIFAWTLGGEQFVLRSGLGGLLIFASLVISAISQPRR